MYRYLNLRSRSARRPQSRLACAARFGIEPLELRTLLSVSILHDYTGIDFNNSGGYVPPDTSGAAGPSSYVETVNQAVRLFTAKTTNSPAVSSSLSSFLFSTGGLPRADSTSGLSDPVVAYDEQIGRFIIGDQDVNFNTHVSRFDIAVSTTSTPTSLGAADWKFYSITTTESGFDADFPGNFGYNHDAFVFTLNMFGVTGGGHTQIVSVNAADLGAAATSPAVFKNDLNDFSLRPTTMHDSVAGDPMWLVTEHGDNASIDVIKMTSVLTNSATFSYTNLAVTPYSNIVAPKNPNGTTITTNIDSRILKAAEANNTLVATHAVGASSTQDVVQWYKINLSGATPTLADQGRVSAGSNTYLYYPGIDINATGNIGMSFMRSGTDTSTDYMSTWVTARASSDAAGTGQTNYTDFAAGHRAGDLSGINVDPVDGSFWAANEFANTEATANWGTAIVHFNVVASLLSTDTAVTSSGPSSVTAGTNATYTITITNNGPNDAQGVALIDTLPAGSTLVSMTRTSGTDTFTLAQSGGTVTQTASANIASGSSDTFTLVVFAPTSLANGATFNNTSSVSAQNSDPNTSNNTSTVTGTIVNTSTNADVAVSVSGPSTANEGNQVTYTITLTNNGPAGATGVSLADTLGSLLNFQSATATQGTFIQSSGVVMFNIGTIAAGANVTATVTAQAIEEGSTSNSASISSTSADPNSANNLASQTTVFAEPPIVVSGTIRTNTRTLSNFQVATFTHANGVEPITAFVATINWGDGTSSGGTIVKSGTTYTVSGSHTYTKNGSHSITTAVVESGLAVDKLGNEADSPNWKMQDVVQLPGNSAGRLATPLLSPGWASVSPIVATGADDSILVAGTSPLA